MNQTHVSCEIIPFLFKAQFTYKLLIEQRLASL